MNIPLNINFQQILLHLFNFTILTGGLYFLLYKPVKDFMDKRTAHYRDMEQKANEKMEEAEKIEEEYKSRLTVIENEIQEKKALAEKDLNEQISAELEEARKQRDKIIAEAQGIAQNEKKKILMEAREEVVKLAMAATKKMLSNEEGSCE